MVYFLHYDERSRPLLEFTQGQADQTSSWPADLERVGSLHEYGKDFSHNFAFSNSFCGIHRQLESPERRTIILHGEFNSLGRETVEQAQEVRQGSEPVRAKGV